MKFLRGIIKYKKARFTIYQSIKLYSASIKYDKELNNFKESIDKYKQNL